VEEEYVHLLYFKSVCQSFPDNSNCKGVGAGDDESDDKNEPIVSQTRSKAGDDAGSQFGRSSAYKKRS
jgi:hypothetical protein